MQHRSLVSKRFGRTRAAAFAACLVATACSAGPQASDRGGGFGTNVAGGAASGGSGGSSVILAGAGGAPGSLGGNLGVGGSSAGTSSAGSASAGNSNACAVDTQLAQLSPVNIVFA